MNQSSEQATAQSAVRRTALRLCLIALGMFGFGFALVPLYDLFCDITGLGGATGGQYTYDPAESRVDKSRLVKVNFLTNTNGRMPWKFWSEKGGIRVHPGALNAVKFYVTNTTSRRMVGQAVPSVVPLAAAEYFHKTECFCFSSQVLEPGETLEMPLRFIVDSQLPANVQSISLSYALFDVSDFATSQTRSGDAAGGG
ncbi:MAG: cytochrome c oxidase assembly protein [Gammaproteobacteria bacterium]|nr:cytochrome c oxidase assembly protein [Gammaproteobacteria bacterium]